MSKRHSTKVASLHTSPAAAKGSAASDTRYGELLGLLPSCVITITPDYMIRYVNTAAESFLGGSLLSLRGHALSHFIHPAERLLTLIDVAFAQKTLIKEYGFTLSGPRMGSHTVNLQILPLDDGQDAIIVIDDRGMAGKLGQHILGHEGTRAAGSMAAILAHEVKNPLSGIRGAAQLLEKTVSAEDRKLTGLICAEVDRIRDVIDEVEIFSNPSELKTEAVNIHEVLQYVCLLAGKGEAAHVRFHEQYDPSIPPVAGHRNLLIQLFLNLVKNAAEAMAGKRDGVITLSTSYQSGFRLKSTNGVRSQPLSIVVSVEDNGPGIAAALEETLFDPFVTTKKGGRGLGLAVVAKIITDLGGAIECDKEAKEGARFRILLPAA